MSCHFPAGFLAGSHGFLEVFRRQKDRFMTEMEKKWLKGKKQEKLDEMLEKEKRPQEFTHKGILHAVSQLVACNDQVWCEKSS